MPRFMDILPTDILCKLTDSSDSEVRTEFKNLGAGMGTGSKKISTLSDEEIGSKKNK